MVIITNLLFCAVSDVINSISDDGIVQVQLNTWERERSEDGQEEKNSYSHFILICYLLLILTESQHNNIPILTIVGLVLSNTSLLGLRLALRPLVVSLDRLGIDRRFNNQ